MAVLVRADAYLNAARDDTMLLTKYWYLINLLIHIKVKGKAEHLYSALHGIHHHHRPLWGRGTPLPPLSIYFLIFSPFFTFLFLSLALPIFFFCPSLSFLPE